jgi:hypothetical protein
MVNQSAKIPKLQWTEIPIVSFPFFFRQIRKQAKERAGADVFS